MSEIGRRKQRWDNFYNLAHPQRLMFLIRYAPGLAARPLPNPELRQERLEWIWQNYLVHQERMQWLDDDTIPCLDLLGGTEIFAEAFGCPVFRPEDNNPFALPCVHNAEEARRLLIPSLDAPAMAFVFSLADELSRRAGPEAVFRLVDLQSPMDVAALIWEKTDFYAAFLEAPEAVLELAEKIRTLQFQFLEEWFSRYGRECIAHYPDYYLSTGISLSVDEIGAVSPKMFERFFLPDLIQFSTHFDGLGIHCCAHARHQWTKIRQVPGLKLLNINGQGETVRDAYACFADLVAMWHYDQSSQALSPVEWLQNIPENAHIVFDLSVQTREEAIQVSQEFSGLRSRAG